MATPCLRGYQRECAEAAAHEWDEGRNTLAVLATGTGKTVIAGAVARAQAEAGKRGLFLVHRDELVTQTVDKFSRFGLPCAIEKAGSRAAGSAAPVTVASVQTLARASRLRAFDPREFGYVIVDEAHHSAAGTYRGVLDYFGAARRLGLTATPDRSDHRELGSVFDTICYEYGIRDAVSDGYLSPIKARLVPLDIDISSVGVQGGDYSSRQSGEALEGYLPAIARAMGQAGCPSRKTIVFTPLVETAHALADELNRVPGIRACEVDGTSGDRG